MARESAIGDTNQPSRSSGRCNGTFSRTFPPQRGCGQKRLARPLVSGNNCLRPMIYAAKLSTRRPHFL